MEIILLDILNIKEIVTPEEFKKTLTYFTDFDLEDKRLEVYTQYADKKNCSTEEAKDQILRTFFSNYILKSIKNAVELAKEDDKDAFSLINQLEELKPIFKEYDVNTFASFISSVEKGLSVTNSEILFNTHYVGDEFLEEITTNLIKSISNPIQKVNSVSDFTQKFFTHPLLHCLQAKNEMDKTLSYIENGTLEVGQYKQLISLVLQHRTVKNDESVDFFISYLIKEDILNGFYNIYKDENYKHEEIKKLLLKVSKGETLFAFELENAVNSVAELKVTISTDTDGKIKYASTSSKTLNDSGFNFNIGKEEYFFHLHTAQNKGENQNGQQATTLNVLNKSGINSLSCTFVKKNAGNTEHGLDICSSYGLELQSIEKILLSNLQYEANAFSTLSSSLKKAELDKTTYLSSNLRIVKDSVKDSIQYNQMHFNTSDEEIIKNKASLYIGFISKYYEKLGKIKDNTDSDMSIQSQVISGPLVNIIKQLLKLEYRVGVLFSNEQINIISKFISKESLSPSINDTQDDIILLIKQPRDRTKLNKNEDKFSSVLVDTETLDVANEKDLEKKQKRAEKQKRKRKLEKIANKIHVRTRTEDYYDVMEILEALESKHNVKFAEGNYSNPSSGYQYFLARKIKPDHNKNTMKSPHKLKEDIELINLFCDYAREAGGKIGTYYEDFTQGFKPKK